MGVRLCVSAINPARLAVFSDFDGTIAEKDMIGRILMQFYPKQAEPIIEQVNRREIGIRSGVEQLFALIPSAKFAEVRDFAVESTRLRQGFGEFVEYTQKADIPLKVVSGGFDFFVEPALAQFASKLEIYCNQIDASEEFLKVVWSHPCDETCSRDCGLCKPTILHRFKPEFPYQVLIGDGVTDLAAALEADFVFARDRLLAQCQRQGLRHAPFDTFYDIINYFEKNGLEVPAGGK